MKQIALLISPRAKNAYFNDYLEVARAEAAWVTKNHAISHKVMGAMDFFELEAEPDQLPKLASLTFVHGIFEMEDGKLTPLDHCPQLRLHEDFVFGSKYKGKTNEMLTQLLINIGLAAIDYKSLADVKLLDPMAGKGTTMLTAMRMGIKSKGIEQDHTALGETRQMVKKWCKVHRQRHDFRAGSVGKKGKAQTLGKFIEFEAEGTSWQLITGNSKNACKLLKGEKFNLLVSDLPYGVQHFTTDKTRNPMDVLRACAPDWVESLKKGGVMVLSFNSYIPKREELIELFTEQNLELLDFAAPHRMSESIVRDLVVFKKK